MVSLTKLIVAGELRFLALQAANYDIGNVPIAARDRASLYTHFGDNLFQLRQIDITNFIVVSTPPFQFVYANPWFNGYREPALEVLSRPEWPVEVDHVLGKATGRKWDFGYVLLQRIDRRTNRVHGYAERPCDLIPRPVEDLLFADGRISNKSLARGPRFWKTEALKYDPRQTGDAGLTLKQKGKWAWCLGMNHNVHHVAGLEAVPAPTSNNSLGERGGPVDG
jgi:hypothetical protein